jgi:NHL repeat
VSHPVSVLSRKVVVLIINHGWESRCSLAWVLPFACLLLLLSAVSGTAVELTMVRHRFDISHNFRQPSDVTVNTEGNIFILDGVNHCVKVFNSGGQHLLTFGQRGENPGDFIYPLGFDIDRKGLLYVADTGNRRIQVFSEEGKFLSLFPVKSSGEKPADPTDIAVTADGTIGLVVDNDNHCIIKYDLVNGHFLARFGGPGIERMEFRYPFLAALYDDKYLHVVDVINTRVQVITTQGKFSGFIGGWGVEKGQFFRPKGVAVDRDGMVYVSDSYMGVIQVFTAEGHFDSVIGNPSTGEVERFHTPVGIFVDNNKRLYVVEMFSDRVRVFDMVVQ